MRYLQTKRPRAREEAAPPYSEELNDSLFGGNCHRCRNDIPIQTHEHMTNERG